MNNLSDTRLNSLCTVIVLLAVTALLEYLDLSILTNMIIIDFICPVNMNSWSVIVSMAHNQVWGRGRGGRGGRKGVGLLVVKGKGEGTTRSRGTICGSFTWSGRTTCGDGPPTA